MFKDGHPWTTATIGKCDQRPFRGVKPGTEMVTLLRKSPCPHRQRYQPSPNLHKRLMCLVGIAQEGCVYGTPGANQASKSNGLFRRKRCSYIAPGQCNAAGDVASLPPDFFTPWSWGPSRGICIGPFMHTANSRCKSIKSNLCFPFSSVCPLALSRRRLPTSCQ